MAWLRARVSRADDLVLALKAMVEQAQKPPHDKVRCGSNDCRACEWTSIAKSIGWPSWAEEE